LKRPFFRCSVSTRPIAIGARTAKALDADSASRENRNEPLVTNAVFVTKPPQIGPHPTGVARPLSPGDPAPDAGLRPLRGPPPVALRRQKSQVRILPGASLGKPAQAGFFYAPARWRTLRGGSGSTPGSTRCREASGLLDVERSRVPSPSNFEELADGELRRRGSMGEAPGAAAFVWARRPTNQSPGRKPVQAQGRVAAYRRARFIALRASSLSCCPMKASSLSGSGSTRRAASRSSQVFVIAGILRGHDSDAMGSRNLRDVRNGRFQLVTTFSRHMQKDVRASRRPPMS
jgi:hypothetical protein